MASSPISAGSRRRRSPGSSISTTALSHPQIRAVNPSKVHDLSNGFAEGLATPYGFIPPPRFTHKGKARATDPSIDNDLTLNGGPNPSDESAPLALCFARTSKASHNRARSTGAGSSDGIDGFLSDGSRIHRPSTPRRITDEAELRRNIAKGGYHPGTLERAQGSRSSSSDREESRERSRSKKRTRKPKSGTARPMSAAPMALRGGLPSQASLATAGQYSRLIGQPVLASASISAPEQSSMDATCAALPTLYKASRGRSIHVSPSRQRDRRCNSASVLSGSEELSDAEAGRRRSRISQKNPSSDRRSLVFSTRAREPSHEGALFPSDDDDDGVVTESSAESEIDDALASNAFDKRRRWSRRWSSVERDRRKGMRILLSPGRTQEVQQSSKGIAAVEGRRVRRTSMSSERTMTSECPSELDASLSSCSSSSDVAGESRRAIEALSRAIPIRQRPRSPFAASVGGAFSLPDGGPPSLDNSTPSLSSSAPSTSLVQPSPPPKSLNKPTVAVAVASGADPLLGFTMGSIEDIIEVERVQFCGEDSASDSDRRTEPERSQAKAGRKLKWIIGDAGEDEADIVEPSSVRHSPPSQAPSYQARLAGLLWARGGDGRPVGGHVSSNSEDASDAVEAPSLLSNSWRSLARLPNLILLPGLAARQIRESMTAASLGAPREASAGGSLGDEDAMADLATIFKNASSQGTLSVQEVEARRLAAIRMGRPPSPSPSPSPSTSLTSSRQSSSDRIDAVHGKTSSPTALSAKKRGRGVASLYEGDHDPSAYVSGLGQPIDPDTELSSVVHLQTFRSRSRSRSAIDNAPTTAPKASTRERSKRNDVGVIGESSAAGLEDVVRPALLDGVPDGEKQLQHPKVSRGSSTALELRIAIPEFDGETHGGGGQRLYDTASAPTSPTYRHRQDQDSDRSESSSKQSEDDDDGFRLVQTRRQRRRSSGPRSTRPKVEALVPRDFSAFAIDEEEEVGPESDPNAEGRGSRSRSRGRHARGRTRGSAREGSPDCVGKRQCAVGLFGGGVSSRRREGASSSSSSSSSYANATAGVRTVRSSPNLTYAAAAARSSSSTDEDEDGISPPRGSRGRRGAVKVVASSVGQSATPIKALRMASQLRRGPSYPPRASSPRDLASAASADNSTAGPSGHGAVFSSGAQSVPAHLRLRLLSNSSHLLMLSLELEMIKKHKISGPLKPRWGKHRANDFVPLRRSCDLARELFRAPLAPLLSSSVSDGEGGVVDQASAVGEEPAWRSRGAGGSRLKFCWIPDE